MKPRALSTLLCVATILAGGPAARLAAQQAVPTPESVLGFQPGADYRLARYEESIDYFRRLAASSDYIRLVEVGRTSLGRPWTLAIISSPENLRNLDHYREIAQRLAHPAGLSDAEARQLVQQTKAFVDISGGLHASEVAGAQHTIQLAHDLIAGTADPKLRAILDNVVLFLWPSINPDGQDIVADWYRENVGTSYEGAPLHELYQKYIGHDNNRDAYMLNVQESRVVARTWRQWEPQIIYVQHQSSPFPTRIWLPPFAEPIAPRVPPLMSREVNAIGMLIAQGLESNGQPGATHMGTGYDAWYPGYIDYMPMMQNIAAFWTETALYNYATPHFYTMSDFPQNMRDLRPGALYSSPWPGGWWRLRDAVDYMVTASISVLDYAAKYKDQLLYNRYQAGRDAIHRYEKEPPYAYIVPQAQRDPGVAADLLRRLAFNGIRIAQLTRDADVRWRELREGHVGDSHESGVCRAGAPAVRCAGLPGSARVSGWSTRAALRRGGLDAAVPDGRACDHRGRATARRFPRGHDDAAGGPGCRGQCAGRTFRVERCGRRHRAAAGRITGTGAHLAVDAAENNAFR